MGIIPVPDTPGPDCLLCYPAGEAPDMLKLFLGGIQTGDLWSPPDPAPPNGYWDLQQRVASPCFYDLVPIGTFAMGYSPFRLTPMLVVQAVGVSGVFSSTSPFNCQKSFINAQVNPVVNWYYGGWAYVATASQIAGWIELVTPLTGPDPRMELFLGEDDRIFVRFADKKSSTNIMIELDTTVI